MIRSSPRDVGARAPRRLHRQPRPVTVLALCAAIGWPAACVDFIEPDISNLALPATLTITLRAFDSGVLQVDGTLSPGRDDFGFVRGVQSAAVHAVGHTLEPRTLTPAGVRTYATTIDIPPRETTGPFELIAPTVLDVGSVPPLLWYGLRRLDPDTLRLPTGTDVVLHMDTAAAQSQPGVGLRQWFLEIRSGANAFRLSGDAAPPLTLRIPAEWLPPSATGTATISMIYYQTAQLRSPENAYVANVTLDTRLLWIVEYADPAPDAARPAVMVPE